MHTKITIRPLALGDADACVAIRREMLADAPWAFSASVETDVGVDPGAVRARLANPAHATIGAFDQAGLLLGVAGLRREERAKMAHRASVWGVYVTPAARGQRLARRIISHAIEFARSWPGVTSVGLSCSEKSIAARKTYESLGFVAWGREPAALQIDGSFHDEYHLVLFLGSTVGAVPSRPPYAPS